MKRVNRTIRLGYFIVLLKNGEKVARAKFKIKARLLAFAQVRPFTEGLIRVSYGNNLNNEAKFYSIAQLKKYLKYFTSKDLLDYADFGQTS